ncbi:hypothetical protein HK405_004305 [Cladochytrium tenue]|nr:hypothetical protein HK405_004305 [Cladochytrium tenue]
MPVDFFPPVVLSDPPFAPPWLVSFHVGRFAGFTAITVGVGYPLYRLIGVRWLRWEAHPKSPAMHFGDVTSAIGYNLALFIGGNYSNTLTAQGSWIMTAAFLPSLFLFGWLAEAPFLRHSFATVRRWPVGMHVTVAIAVLLVLAAAAYHLRLAYVIRVDAGSDGQQCLLGWYLLLVLGVPLALAAAGAGVAAVQNRTRAPKLDTSGSGGAASGGSSATSISIGGSADGLTGAGRQLAAAAWPRVVFHPHHWAIFYALGFLTRWEDPVSNACAGVVIGSYMHGVAAYGYGHLLEV